MPTGDSPALLGQSVRMASTSSPERNVMPFRSSVVGRRAAPYVTDRFEQLCAMERAPVSGGPKYVGARQPSVTDFGSSRWPGAGTTGKTARRSPCGRKYPSAGTFPPVGLLALILGHAEPSRLGQRHPGYGGTARQHYLLWIQFLAR